MNSEQILTYIHQPELLQKAAAEDLQRALEEYPYSSILQVLYLKALKNQNNYLYPKQLKRAALAVPNRKKLHDWVEAEVTPKAAVKEEKPALAFHAKEAAEKTPPVEIETIAPVVPPPAREFTPTPPLEAPAAVVSQVEPLTHPPVPVPPIPVPLPNSEPVKEDDLDLMNLPASVRETVLRARKIRGQFGGDKAKVEKPISAPTPTPTPPASVPVPEVVPVAAPIPVPQIPIEPAVEEEKVTPKGSVEIGTQSVSDPEPFVPEEINQSLEEAQKEIVKQSKVSVWPSAESEEEETENFVLSDEEPIEQEIAPKVAVSTNKKHSFLDWLETGLIEDEVAEDVHVADEKLPDVAEESFVIDDAEEIEEPKPEVTEPEEIAEPPATERVKELYQSFIEKPRLQFRAPASDDKIDLAALNTSGHSDYITETLAQLYVGQKLYNRAINAYEILRLKYPEKSSFFATRISEIKQLLNEKD